MLYPHAKKNPYISCDLQYPHISPENLYSKYLMVNDVGKTAIGKNI
jgi:hypothetical protein